MLYLLLKVLHTRVEIIHAQRHELCTRENIQRFLMLVVMIAVEKCQQVFECVECSHHLLIAIRLVAPITFVHFHREGGDAFSE